MLPEAAGQDVEDADGVVARVLERLPLGERPVDLLGGSADDRLLGLFHGALARFGRRERIAGGGAKETEDEHQPASQGFLVVHDLDLSGPGSWVRRDPSICSGPSPYNLIIPNKLNYVNITQM